MTGSGAMPLWTAADAALATKGQTSTSWLAYGVSIDSRTLKSGDLFVAVCGPDSDGHDYVADALAKGAAAAVVSGHPEAVSADAPLLRVDDTLAGLQALGMAARSRTSAHVIAITGSVGKTSTKEALRLALSSGGLVAHASEASFNNQWGVPLSLARMPADSAFGIFELGMNHPDELEPLSRMVRPHAAIITTVEPAHLAYFKNIAAIADAKAEVFSGLEPEGTAILNRDNSFFGQLADAAERHGARRVLGFGHDPAAWAHIVDATTFSTSSSVSAEIGGKAITYTIGAAGRHWVMNSLATLATVAAFGGDLDEAASTMSQMTALRGRGERHQVPLGAGTIEVIDESYNASPPSMRAAIDMLGGAQPGAGGRRIAVLGDMLELGPDSPRLHAQLARDIAYSRIDLVFTAGSNMARLSDALASGGRGPHCDKSTQLVTPLLDLLRPGDVVMVKGSLGSQMTLVVDALLEANDFSRQAKCG
jgi:UDP-N-acetylmuramoyl-tripeptide--D-alanyl-D-alanine ligase